VGMQDGMALTNEANVHLGSVCAHIFEQIRRTDGLNYITGTTQLICEMKCREARSLHDLH
jgi:hypothetical protein